VGCCSMLLFLVEMCELVDLGDVHSLGIFVCAMRFVVVFDVE